MHDMMICATGGVDNIVTLSKILGPIELVTLLVGYDTLLLKRPNTQHSGHIGQNIPN